MLTYKLIDYNDKRIVYNTFQALDDNHASEIAKSHYNLYWIGLYRFEGRKRLYEVDFRAKYREEYKSLKRS